MTTHLPDRPSLEQLRRQARELQRAVRAGAPPAVAEAGRTTPDPAFRLSAAQRLIAHRYEFASWPRLQRHVRVIEARTWAPSEPRDPETTADRFLRLACLDYVADDADHRAQAAAMLRADPGLSAIGLAAAVVCADVPEVGRRLRTDPAAATTPTGPHSWTPVRWLAYGRVATEEPAAVATLRLLLTAGADPNDGHFLHGLATPFTVVTGLVGGGESDQTPHPHAAALLPVVLAAGADPNDAQAVYDLQFRTDDTLLAILLAHGLGSGDGGPWRRALPDLLARPPALLRRLLRWAVLHDQRARVTLLGSAGVDLRAPYRSGRTPLALALANGHHVLADQLRAAGSVDAPLDPLDAVVGAALSGHAEELAGFPHEVLATARDRRPGLLAWAAGGAGSVDLAVIVAAGWDLDALGRGDVPVEQPWQTALHSAVERGDPALVRQLLELGADTTVRDARFDGTAADWAAHLGREEIAEMLAAYG